MLTYVPHGSFLNHPAPTNAALIREVSSDPVLRTRLKHALNLSTEGEVIRLTKSLHREPLASARVLKVFYARPNGAWGYKVRRVPAGTLVFADGQHNPRLMQVCGNPVAGVSSAILAHPQRVQKYSPTENEVGMVQAPDLIPPPPLDLTANAPSDLIAPIADVPEAPVSAVAATVPVVPVATSSSAVLPSSVGSGSGFPAWIFAAAAPFALTHGGSSSSTPVDVATGTPVDNGGHGTFVPPTGGPGVTPPIAAAAPEPDAVALMGVAGGLLALGQGIARRRRRNG